MNKTLLFSLFVSAVFSTDAQEVVSSQGESYSGAGGTMDFTIGEVVINTVSGGSATLTQGFHQTNWKFVGLEDHASDMAVIVFPNPASEYLQIQTTDYTNVSYTLYDEAGRLVAQGQLLAETTSVRVAELATGHYSLILSSANQELKIFKLIKSL